jgi:hypothetical protein
MGRRHPDVDDHDIRALAGDDPEEPRNVGRLADDLEAGRRERCGEGLAQQDGIVGERDSERGSAIRGAIRSSHAD